MRGSFVAGAPLPPAPLPWLVGFAGASRLVARVDDAGRGGGAGSECATGGAGGVAADSAPILSKGCPLAAFVTGFRSMAIVVSLSLSDEVELEDEVLVRIGDCKSPRTLESGDGNRETVCVNDCSPLGDDGYCNQPPVLGA